MRTRASFRIHSFASRTKNLLLSLAVLLFFFREASEAAVPLSELISGLYGGNGITLGAATRHDAHFTRESGDALNQLNDRLGTDFGVFPFNSSAGNFSFAFDADLGTFVSTTDTLGPIFAERAPTVGRGKWNVSFYATFFDYDEFNGQNLHDLHVEALHQPDEPPQFDPDGPIRGKRSGFELDTLDINVDIDASVRIFSPAVTFGLTDKLDVSVFFPIVDVDMDVRSYYRLNISPLNPTPDIHLTNVVDGAEAPADRASGSATGIGDIVLGAKYQFYKSGTLDLAGAFLAQLANGDKDNFLGSGDNTLRPFLVASRTFRALGGSPLNLTPHVNMGYEFNVDNFDRSAFEYIVGFDAGTRRVTLASELLGSHNQEGEDRFDAAVGVKWNVYKRLVLLGNVIFPLNDTGLRSDLITTLGVGMSF